MVYPVTISLAMKSVKQSSMSAVNQRRGAEGKLWQPRFFDRALRTVKEYNEKVEYLHLKPDYRAGERGQGIPRRRYRDSKLVCASRRGRSFKAPRGYANDPRLAAWCPPIFDHAAA
jgi:hypothetical protein